MKQIAQIDKIPSSRVPESRNTSEPRVLESLAAVCLHARTTVIRTWRSGHIIMRRRMCVDCKVRFNTEEKAHTATNDKYFHCHVKNDESHLDTISS